MNVKKTLFNASFEESLNLYDDSISGAFIKENFSSAQEKEKFRGTVRSNILLFILTIIFIFGPNWLILKTNSYLIPYVKDYFQISYVINFLPDWLYWIFTSIWLLLIFVLKVFNQNFLLIYRGQFHLYVSFLVWLMLEVNLLFFTFFSGTIGIMGIVIFVSIVIAVSYVIINNRISSLNYLFYKVNTEDQNLGKVTIKFSTHFSKLLWILIVVTIAVLIVFPIKFKLLLSLISFIAILAVITLLFVTCETYYIFPFFLNGYYKWKYPEEYREWEGKSVEEWYGKRYLKKHKELLENE